MDDELIHIGTAAAALCDKVAARKAALERILLTDPHLPTRREAEAEYLALTSDDDSRRNP